MAGLAAMGYGRILKIKVQKWPDFEFDTQNNLSQIMLPEDLLQTNEYLLLEFR